MRRLALAALLAGTGWLLASSSGWPVIWHGADAAMLRLSWVARPERIEECRDLTPEELDARPAHMRQARECLGGSATYRLTVGVDDQTVATDVLTGGGMRSDRAIFVLRELPLQPGIRRVRIQFARVEPATAPMDSANVRRGAVPRALVLDTVVTVPVGAVALASFADGALSLKLP